MEHTRNGEIGHNVGDPGVATNMYFDPETKVDRILFVNTDFVDNGQQQFIDMWNKLDEYAGRLNKTEK